MSDLPETMAPRTALGAISDMYRMMIADTKPTPKPAIRRPATNSPRELDEQSGRIQPMPYTTQPRMTVVLRPNQSARSPAKMAPKKVPADKDGDDEGLVWGRDDKSIFSAVVAFGPGIGNAR
jgi:hypothetical protein